MKRLLFFFSTIVLLASCGYKFDRYPGKEQSFIPENMWGEYKFKEGKVLPLFGKKIDADSVRIRVMDNNIMALEGKQWQQVFRISKSAVFSAVTDSVLPEGKYYALSSLDTSAGSYWNSIILMHQGDEITLYPLFETTNDFRKEPIMKYLPLKMRVIEKDGKTTVSDVTDDKIAIANKVAYNDNDTIIYFEMNEDKLIQYIQKELKPRKGMRYIKINTQKKK